MEQIYQRCCGIEVRQGTVNACTRIGSAGDDEQGLDEKVSQEIRSFGAAHDELLALRGWLRELEVTHVAIEGRGESWRPVYELLEDGFDLTLVDAAEIKRMYARRPELEYCEWLAILLQLGLLPESFVTPANVDVGKIDEAVLALLYLSLHDGSHAWKGFDWDSMDRLHRKGFISNPASKAKSVIMSEQGINEARRLFKKLFTHQK